jgi:hypothetical protein
LQGDTSTLTQVGAAPRPLEATTERGVELLGRTDPGTTSFFARAAGSGLVVTHVGGSGGAVRPGAQLDPGALAADLAATVRLSSGEPVGVLAVVGPADRSTLETLAALLGTVASLELEVGEQRARASQAESEALYDPLTGLGNRRLWSGLVEM